MAEGVRASYLNLKSYREKHGLKSIGAIITRWAPNNENDTSAYIKSVQNHTGHPAHMPYPWEPGKVVQLLEAIFKHENGLVHLVDYETIKNVVHENWK